MFKDFRKKKIENIKIKFTLSNNTITIGEKKFYVSKFARFRFFFGKFMEFIAS
jgi:hypothetical protein